MTISTGRQLLDALILLRHTVVMDEPLYATFGNDENGNADLIPILNLLPANDSSINGTFLDGKETPVIVLDDEGKENSLDLLEEMLAMMEHTTDRMMKEDYDRFKVVCSLTADLREGMDAL